LSRRELHFQLFEMGLLIIAAIETKDFHACHLCWQT
jgi:hypothetical protein